jgi:NAD(P)-dependent dehydrogenase (short-subunit alcohol dehydrogenase family)
MTGRDLAGAVVFVTGGSRGLGAAVAAEFASRGAQVAVTARRRDDAEAVVGKLDGDHLALTADVRSEASLDAAVSAVTARFGRLDVVVANAGVHRHGSVSDLSADAYAEVVDTNLVGVYRTVRATLEPLVAARGYLLLVSSVAGFAAVGGMAAYASAKAGLEMLGHTLHLDLAPRGVAVGAIVPTWITTDMLAGAEDDVAGLADVRSSTADLLAHYTAGVPGGPLGGSVTPEECAAAMADAAVHRARRVWLPPILEEVWRLGPVLNGPLGEVLTQKLVSDFPT